MSFFQPPPPPPPVPDFPPTPMLGRYVPGVVPLEQVLAHNDRAAIVLRALYVYPDGVSFQMDSYMRHREDSDVDVYPRIAAWSAGPMDLHAGSVPKDNDDEEAGDTAAEIVSRPSRTSAASMQRFLHRGFTTFDDFNFGVQFPDGVKVTTLRPYVPDFDLMHPPGEAPTHGLDMGGGGGSDEHYEYSFFVWPLPAPGTLTLVCEWAQYGIPETALPVDTARILDAARRAHVLWEEDEGLPSHHGMASSIIAMQRFTKNFQSED